MKPDLPKELITVPVAHRALHDVTDGRPENSRAAIRAAMSHGYAIEIDVQLSSDGRAMVFHDDALDRLTDASGPVRALPHADLSKIPLKGGDGEGIPDLAEVLSLVGGRVPLLIEIKDQDGQMGPNIGALEAATVRDLEDYEGAVALMSFNPHSVKRLAELAPHIARGIVTSAYDPDEWPELTREQCDHLRKIPDFDPEQTCFISHESYDLSRPLVQTLREQGLPVLCWTVTSAEDERAARVFADNVTFESYLSELTA